MVKKFPDYHLVGEETMMVSLSTRVQVLFYLKSKVNNHFYLKPNLTQFYLKLKVSKSARLVAAGCLVFLVYLLYSYHNLPQEGGEGSGLVVNHQEEEEENSGVPVSPAKQVLSFRKNIWFILTLCRR